VRRRWRGVAERAGNNQLLVVVETETCQQRVAAEYEERAKAKADGGRQPRVLVAVRRILARHLDCRLEQREERRRYHYTRCESQCHV
jgi:hypothetical protein